MSIGEALAQARRQAGLTVSEVSQRTRVRETIITGIEGDDYTACGGDFYARGHIRSIARVVGTDPEPLIRQYDTAQRGPLPSAADETEPATPIRVREQPPRMRERPPNLTAVLVVSVVVVVVALGFLGYHLLAGSHQAASAAPSARSRPVTHPHSSRGRPSAVPGTTPAPRAVPVRRLTPASAAAFNPYGAGQGDSNDPASLAIDGHPATAWHSDWYTTAHFGNLYPGTGLLVDMGRTVTISAIQVTLGRARGADVQVRVGAAPALADLLPVARAAGAGGIVRLRPTAPAQGRYVLIWFTSLPPDPAGTFQASVYDLRLEGPA